jgi:hypothetical protein
MKNENIDINGIIYTVYENGDVYNGSRKIKQRPSYEDGYACFTAGKKNFRRVIRTHTIVGKLFVDNPNNLPELDHLDGNRMNPNADNLEWVSHEENIKRAYEKGSYKGRIIGTKNPKAKLNEETVIDIRKDYENGLNQKEISTKYNIPWSTVHNIVTYQTWKHVI